MDVYTDPGDGFAYLYRLMGDPEFTSERVVAHELGARVRPTDRLSLDVSAFYNVYSNLRSWQIGDPIPMLDEEQPHVIVPVYFANMLHGSTTGYEAALAWDATRNWRVRFGYSRLNYDLEYDPASNDPFGLEGDSSSNSAPNQWFVTSYLDLGRNVELDTMLYYTGALFGMDRKSFHRLDVHLGYRPRQAFEVSLVGQNLLDREDAEHDGALSEIPTHPQKSIFGKLTWFF
jgi:iron complex outermembrane receptor protein